MNRVQADIAVGVAGLIWGFGFVAQKTALDHTGPFTFVAVRFLISALFVLPWALREKPLQRIRVIPFKFRNQVKLVCLCAAFAFAVIMQQVGLTATSVTNTAFLTELYIIFVPFVGYLFYRHPLTRPVLAASLLCIFGVWLLSGGNPHELFGNLGRGDVFIILAAVGFAIQVVVMGTLAKQLQQPLTISFLQYLVVTLIALGLALVFEKMDLRDLMHAWVPVIYAGILSGGVAYTLQAIAQQHTPASDTAIIMSSEALFGGIGGIWLLHEKISTQGLIGCAAIIASILLIEFDVLRKWQRDRRQQPALPHKP